MRESDVGVKQRDGGGGCDGFKVTFESPGSSSSSSRSMSIAVGLTTNYVVLRVAAAVVVLEG